MKKNCNNCKHLEWVDGEYMDGSNSGFDCNKRHEQMYQLGREAELLRNLDREEYRNKGKSCFEMK